MWTAKIVNYTREDEVLTVGVEFETTNRKICRTFNISGTTKEFLMERIQQTLKVLQVNDDLIPQVFSEVSEGKVINKEDPVPGPMTLGDV